MPALKQIKESLENLIQEMGRHTRRSNHSYRAGAPNAPQKRLPKEKPLTDEEVELMLNRINISKTDWVEKPH